jgi:hypothetical protein
LRCVCRGASDLVDLEKAIEAKDFKKFSSGYDKLSAACNACHQGTENGFVVIERPANQSGFHQSGLSAA